ncbi:polyprotein [Bienertia sinuspersici]
MNTSWIELPNNHPAYRAGAIQFLELAKEGLIDGRTLCPCKKCRVKKWLSIQEVAEHIMFKGFDKEYKKWIFHGKGDVLNRILSDQRCSTGQIAGSSSQGSLNSQIGEVRRDDMRDLLGDAFGIDLQQTNSTSPMPNYQSGPPYSPQSSFQDPTPSSTEVHDEKEKVKFERLLEASNKGLYEGCTTFSKLSFLLRMFNIKCMFHLPGECFDMLLELLIEAFPHIMQFPSSYYESKKMINHLGLGYEKIDACPNNCILYRGEFSDKNECPICHASRWKKKSKGGETSGENTNAKNNEPAKVLRYFPLIPRLRRLYMSSKTAEDMIWHGKDREEKKDGKLRHPSDALAWKAFDERYRDFSSDLRSVRLGLASDGFNPYRLMNTTHSTWPVVLVIYNLPPWLCMKRSSFILSSIIPGKSSPGIDIDIFLQPLIDELKLLWVGVDAFDAYSKQNFRLRAALMWTINDFPAYAMLSGWSTKGYYACPVCGHDTFSIRFAGKICYCGNRMWLPTNHPFRSQGHLFDGNEEYGLKPIRQSGTEVRTQQEGVTYVYGEKKQSSTKKRARQDYEDDEDENILWTKRSIFFDLPYWEHNLLRHNLDVMHIEKNVCDNFLGTFLEMDKKNRDDKQSREAIQKMGIKPHLWPKTGPNGQTIMPPASYSMSSEDKQRFLRVLQKLKVPDGYGSNLSRCVNMKQRKLQNLKSHDNHVLMQDILPVALRASRTTEIVEFVSDLSSFFKIVCNTTLDPKELDELQSKIILTLCKMEIEFLPTFFTIMVHLVIHLVEEVKLGGPVHYRWMYPIERLVLPNI